MNVPAKHDPRDLQLGPITLTATAMEFTAAPTREQYLAAMDWLERCNSGVQWWCGDGVNHGLNMFGEEASQGFSRETWRKWAWVAEQVIPKVRRAALSFTHHEVVASLPTREQDKWLQAAEANGWSARELKKQIKGDPDTDADDKIPCPTCGKPWNQIYATGEAE